MKLALLYPYKGDPLRLNAALTHLDRMTDYEPLRVYLCFTGPEDDFENIPEIHGLEVIKFYSTAKYSGPVQAVNYAYHQAKEWGDLFANWSADIELPGPILDRVVESYQRNFPLGGGVLALNDGYWGDKLATHCIFDRLFVEWLAHPGGGIWFDEYKFVGCDNENTERAKKAGRFAYDEKIQFIHPFPWERRSTEKKAALEADRALLDERRKMWR